MVDDGEHDDGHNESRFGKIWYVALQQFFMTNMVMIKMEIDQVSNVL